MDAFSTESFVVPPMTINPKDHKVVGPDDDPKSRPVCDASSCINGRLSDALCEVLTPIANEHGGPEVESGEELLHFIEKLNNEMKKEAETLAK